MDDAIPDMRANRDFRAKFPDDVLHENLAGQLWFGAEVNTFYYFGKVVMFLNTVTL